ncbi:MAG: AMP-binding protein, partial [Acidobacteria bacterium]|nr:AMP-binding protein [Acidobacteriota bacterium]
RLEYARRMDFTADDAFLQKTTLAFDVSIAEIFGPLVAGGRVVQARPGGQRDPSYLVSLMAAAGTTQASFPPGLLEAVLAEPGFSAVTRLRTVVTGGETVPAELAPRFHAASSADLLNRYGPTEATISLTSWRCRRGERPRALPIGYPTARARVVLLDRSWRPVPVGVVGELCIGGPGLARGYLGRPAATAEVFVPDPRSPAAGGRLYRSGDLARWRTDGALDFVGRRDRQVKVRGFRVELGEIEAALRAVPGVAEAAVVDVADGGTRRLAGYWVAAAGDDLENEVLRDALAARLPEYMVPQALRRLETLPRSPTGKIDRKALPAPVWGESPGSGRAPATELEHRLAAIFAEVLGCEAVAADEDFFERGGHSLTAVRLMARIEGRLGRRIPLAELFRRPTVAELAETLAASEDGCAGLPRTEPLVELASGAGEPLVLIHPAGGTVFCYRALAARLAGIRPVWALSAPEIDDGTLPPDLATLAARYLDRVEKQFGEGGWSLGGWSMGGLIALEMARLRARRGATVPELVLIDTFPPVAEVEPPVEGRRQRRIDAFVRHLGLSAGHRAEVAARLEGSHAGSSSGSPSGSPGAMLDGLPLTRLFEVFCAHADRLAVHRVEAWPPALERPRVTLFEATERPPGLAAPAELWRPWLGPDLNVHPLPGDHFSMLEGTAVELLAARLAVSEGHSAASAAGPRSMEE